MSRIILAAFIVIVAYASSVNAQSNPFTCNTTLFDQCMTTFSTSLNLSSAKPYEDPRQFRFQIERYYQSGSFNGFLFFCRTFRQFKSCLGPEYINCMSVPHFAISGKASLQGAYDFVSVFSQQHFTCGAGFDVYLRNEDCLSSTWATHRFHFDNCYKNYYQLIDGQTEAGCTAGRMLSECFESEFVENCSAQRTDVVWWGCEYGRTLMITQFPQCTQDCTTRIIGGI
jgi:hypothetical protein